MKKIIILGATGSLGKQTLEVLKKRKKDFEVLALSSHKNEELLLKQAKEFNVKHVILSSRDGKNSLENLCQLKEADIVVNVLSGVAGIGPTVTTLSEGKTLLLGNKESLIASRKKLNTENIIPIDSEHNAIHEILKKFPDKKIKKIILPCSGGPFFGRKNLDNITVEEALNHPKWKMGSKISLESATLINKGLEIIEAHYLFKIPLNKIEVLVHPEAIVHGIVEFEDFKIAYLSKPDMKEHIENALCESLGLERPNGEIRELKEKEFTFYKPDTKLFKGIDLVKTAYILGDMKKFLSKEEEVLQEFLDKKISFVAIYRNLESFLVC